MRLTVRILICLLESFTIGRMIRISDEMGDIRIWGRRFFPQVAVMFLT
jgi:hypothetical protein